MALGGECGSRGVWWEKLGSEVGIQGALTLRKYLGCSELQLITKMEHSPTVRPFIPTPTRRALYQTRCAPPSRSLQPGEQESGRGPRE